MKQTVFLGIHACRLMCKLECWNKIIQMLKNSTMALILVMDIVTNIQIYCTSSFTVFSPSFQWFSFQFPFFFFYISAISAVKLKLHKCIYIIHIYARLYICICKPCCVWDLAQTWTCYCGHYQDIITMWLSTDLDMLLWTLPGHYDYETSKQSTDPCMYRFI